MPSQPLSVENLGAPLSLEGRVNIYPEAPLPQFNTTGGTAYTARYKNESGVDLMAIVCTSGLPARLDSVNAVRATDSSSLLKLRDSGTLFWPMRNAYLYVLIYERPLSPPYRTTINETYPLMSEDSLNNHFVKPMIGALSELARTGVVHGAIRPTNIFWRDGSTTPPQLGDCLSAPSGVGQPVLFETIERGLSMPIGRGPGTHTDDCYALGITLALLFMGENPLKNMNDQAILQAKINQGSFNALVGTKRLAAAHIELLRGLLADDARQRWTAADLEQWLEGHRMTPKSNDTTRRASRHFAVAGKEYWQTRPLAVALAANVSEAVKLIENESLEKWVLRSLGDENRAEAVREAATLLKESGKTAHYEDQLVARICMALDPAAPIRYRGIAVMPSGIPQMLAEAVITGNNLQTISEIITNQFASFWVDLQTEIKTELVPQTQQLERARNYIEKTSLGNGVERALYETNPALPCLSPFLKDQCVTSPKKLLPALERLAAGGLRPSDPIDRHIAAFLIVRDRQSEALFFAMGPNESPIRRGLALLKLYGEMQYRHGPETLPALAAWLYPLVEPGIKRFLSKPYQEKVRRLAKEAVDKGDLAALLRVVDSPEHVEQDRQQFLGARKMYEDIQQEITNIESRISNRDSFAREVGRPVAAIIASLLALSVLFFEFSRALLRNLW